MAAYHRTYGAGKLLTRMVVPALAGLFLVAVVSTCGEKLPRVAQESNAPTSPYVVHR